MKVVLLSTAPAGTAGSMSRYADLVVSLLREPEPEVDVTRINLALPATTLQRFPAVLRNLLHHAWVNLATYRTVHRVEAGIFHVLDGSHAYVTEAFAGLRTVITVHDMIPLLQIRGELGDKSLSWPARRLVRCSVAGIRDASHLVADSHNTANDLHRLIDINRKTVTVLPLAVTLPAGEFAGHAARRLGVPSSYVLHVGNDAFYKNRQGVLRVFARVRQEIQNLRLVMVGPAPNGRLQHLIQDMALRGAVEFRSDMAERELSALYQNAAFLLFPSLYEGFGWPPLEAMANGCPVVCSNAASLPEVVGDAALTALPHDEEALAQHCISLLKDEDLVRNLGRKGLERARLFSVERLRNGLIAAYEKVLASRP